MSIPSLRPCMYASAALLEWDAHVSPPIVKDLTLTPASESLELPASVVATSFAVASEQNEEWVAEVTVVGLERVSSGPSDVVVALSVGEKVDGSLPSFTADEETNANPFWV
ncbi:hypothetical protein Tco_0681164 [Tanacetum coccineum]|uniref:Uncharacterized protein n=1 Tax=Tanacetum coccineum TaxID=301880 RepID=A0ABQ4XMT1_9ASTR